MLLGILKETLIFQHQDDCLLYRYEIFKNEKRGGYFSVVSLFDTTAKKPSSWEITIPSLILKSSYLPNARIECESHFNEMMSTDALL